MTAIAIPAVRNRLGRLGGRVRSASSGLTAIGVKELRGRMRGRRTFIILTVYLVLIGGFAWMSEILTGDETAIVVEFERWSSIGRGVDAGWLMKRGH